MFPTSFKCKNYTKTRYFCKNVEKMSAALAQHVIQVIKKLGDAPYKQTLYVQHALLVIRVNIGQQTLVRPL